MALRGRDPSQVLQLCAALQAYSPTWVGTFPLGLQVDGSDLDIVCCAPELARFEHDLQAALAALEVAGVPRRAALAPEASVTELVLDGMPVEVFCQPIPVATQRGFRHMIIEGRLLVLGGEALRERVLQQKRAGVKTEPAFAEILGLVGDPYQALLMLESWTQNELAERVKNALR